MVSITDKRVIAVFLVLLIAVPLFFVFSEEKGYISNKRPYVTIENPNDGESVSDIVMISGTAYDPNGDDTLVSVEVMIDSGGWETAGGVTLWSYEWATYNYDDGFYVIHVRSWDGIDYSDIEEIDVQLSNPETAESDSHKWAVFIAVSNFPDDNESKLGNGALNLMEEMTKFFIENYGYSTSNIFILFDDGWIRKDNGYGEREKTLQQRYHEYAITYGSATRKKVESVISRVVAESNRFDDSEVFIWISGHGWGDNKNGKTGGKILERSAVFLWDSMLKDKELGDMLFSLKSQKICVIVDACFSGGFADKTIFGFPELFLLKSNLPGSGRVVVTGASKFREGYASTTHGPLFSLLWFEGVKTGEADGFKPGILKSGKPTNLKMFKDGKVSVEEAFYYACYILRNNEELEDYSKMEPQINDQYPHKGLLRSLNGMILGE